MHRIVNWSCCILCPSPHGYVVVVVVLLSILPYAQHSRASSYYLFIQVPHNEIEYEKWECWRSIGIKFFHSISCLPHTTPSIRRTERAQKNGLRQQQRHCWWVPRTQVCLVWFELNDRYMHHGAFWCVGIFLYMCMWDLCFGVQIEIDSIHIHIANRMFQWIGILRIQELVSSSAGTIQLWFSYLKIHEASAPHQFTFNSILNNFNGTAYQLWKMMCYPTPQMPGSKSAKIASKFWQSKFYCYFGYLFE